MKQFGFVSSICLLPLLLSPFLSSAQLLPAQTARLDSLFDVYAANNRLKGQVALYKNGQPLYRRNVEATPGKAYADSVYRIGSITKMFTAALVFKTIEAGKLRLTDRLSQFFPGLPTADSITLDQLLSHQSGLHNFTDDSIYSSYEAMPQSQAEMLVRFQQNGSDFKPGSKSEYSNTNYVLLTWILEKVNRKDYAQLLNDWILKPLKLRSTRVFEAINLDPREAASYNWDGQWSTAPSTHPSIPLGAGALVSTTDDLQRFATALLEGKIISAASLAQMQQLTRNYGRGIFRVPFYDRFAWGHTGGIDGFASNLAYFPKDSLVFVYLTNGSRIQLNDLGLNVLSAHYNKPFALPTFNSYEASLPELDALAGSFATDQLPLKITITRKGRGLMAQATGQSAFPLDLVEKNKFEFKPAGVVLTFSKDGKEMTLEQGGQTIVFVRE